MPALRHYSLPSLQQKSSIHANSQVCTTGQYKS